MGKDMLRNKTLLCWLSSLLIALCLLQGADSYAQSKAASPPHVNKIFIAPVPNIKELGIGPILEAELGRRGFDVVSRVSDAEAILSLVSAKEIATTEYDIANIPKTTSDSVYRFALASPNRTVVWKVKFKFGSMGATADNEYAARKVAEKMAKKFRKK